jgi:hypothetical protein
MDYKNLYIGYWPVHDTNSCKVLKEYEQSPLKKTYKLMQQIADKYSTTISEMKKHRVCIEYIKR